MIIAAIFNRMPHAGKGGKSQMQAPDRISENPRQSPSRLENRRRLLIHRLKSAL
jgi:hypothetical protein